MSLSDKIDWISKAYPEHDKKMGMLWIGDVKKFIKKIKKLAEDCEKGNFNDIVFNAWVDKLAGKELSNG